MELDRTGARYDYRKDSLYVSKSISLVTPHSFVNTSSKVLSSIYKFISRSDYDIHVLESFIYNLLYDIPLPSPGRSVRFWSLGSEAFISLPKEPDELPVFDYPLLDFFDILGVENALKLLTCVLLGFSVWGNILLRQEFNPIWFLPRESYLAQWHKYNSQYFPSQGEHNTPHHIYCSLNVCR